MAWTAPATFTDGSVLTGAQLNTNLRDNLNETAPAKATTAGRIFVATGTNAIAERAIATATVATNDSCAITSYGALASAGPAVTVTTGTSAIVFVSAQMHNGSADVATWAAYAVTGATAIAASDAVALETTSATTFDAYRATAVSMPTLTPGSNTFTMQYKTASSTAQIQNRTIIVIAL